MPLHNRSQPPTNFDRFVVHAIRERMTKSLHACSQAFGDRLTPDGETTVTASLAADVRKTKEVDSLRLALTSHLKPQGRHPRW